MLDKIDRKLLALLQQDCTLSLQALAEAVNLTTTPCWKRLKRLEDDGILIGKVALLGAASCREVELVLVMVRRLLGIPKEAKP